MDNLSIARVLVEIADLLEIKNENPFKIRAYRNAADVIAHHPDPVAGLPPGERRTLPGIGKDLAAKIGELVDSGAMAYHQALLQEFPPTILDLLHLQGVGPKTVALLYHQLGIRSLDDLEHAARDGRLRRLRGMGVKKEAAILQSLEQRSRLAGRQLISAAHDAAAPLVAWLQDQGPGARVTAVGSLRRGCDTCGDLDILAAGDAPGVVNAFTRYQLVERVFVHGQTKSSVLLWGGIQADLRVVPEASAGAALQYFTGSKAHNIALRDRALQRGLKLNEYGVFDAGTGEVVAGETEESVYAALGLPWIPPELREDRGEFAAAAQGTLPRLVQVPDLQGDVHMHTTASDGRADAWTMARAARDAGLQYIAITDHTQSLSMAGGLDERRTLAHAREVRALNGRDDLDGLTVLAGVECDILPDGRMDLAADCLAELDIVVASVHSALQQDEAQMTERLLRAIECPWVDILGHPTGRRLFKRDAARVAMDRVFSAAAASGVALEINGQPHRLDLDDMLARQAHARGVSLVIDSDAHSPAALEYLRWGVMTARRAWVEPADVLNSRPVAAFRASLRRHRRT